MTITQTVEIPENRRITVDVPPQIPTGRVVLTFSPAVEPAIAEEASLDEVMASGRKILAKHLPAFKALAK